MADKKFNFAFSTGEIMSTSIYKSQGGYNYASVNIEKGNEQYISLSYEWKGDKVPDFAMDMLGFMQMGEEKASKEFVKEAAEFTARLKECL